MRTISLLLGGNRSASEKKAAFVNELAEKGGEERIDNAILWSIKRFCSTRVSPKIELMAPSDDENLYRLAKPNVRIGWFSPPEQAGGPPLPLSDEVRSAAPAIFVGMDDGDDDGREAGINVRLAFVVYNPGEYPEQGHLVPNGKGYRDLLNLIYLVRQALSSEYIADRTAAMRPFRWGVYPQQSSGYWTGWLTFRAPIAPLPYIGAPELIHE